MTHVRTTVCKGKTDFLFKELCAYTNTSILDEIQYVGCSTSEAGLLQAQIFPGLMEDKKIEDNDGSYYTKIDTAFTHGGRSTFTVAVSAPTQYHLYSAIHSAMSILNSSIKCEVVVDEARLCPLQPSVQRKLAIMTIHISNNNALSPITPKELEQLISKQIDSRLDADVMVLNGPLHLRRRKLFVFIVEDHHHRTEILKRLGISEHDLATMSLAEATNKAINLNTHKSSDEVADMCNWIENLPISTARALTSVGHCTLLLTDQVIFDKSAHLKTFTYTSGFVPLVNDNGLLEGNMSQPAHLGNISSYIQEIAKSSGFTSDDIMIVDISSKCNASITVPHATQFCIDAQPHAGYFRLATTESLLHFVGLTIDTIFPLLSQVPNKTTTTFLNTYIVVSSCKAQNIGSLFGQFAEIIKSFAVQDADVFSSLQLRRALTECLISFETSQALPQTAMPSVILLPQSHNSVVSGNNIVVTTISRKLNIKLLLELVKLVSEIGVITRIRQLSKPYSRDSPSILDFASLEILVHPFVMVTSEVLDELATKCKQCCCQYQDAKDPVDIAVQEDTASRLIKRVAVFDMDSTLIRQECIDEMAVIAGVDNEVKLITHKAMNGEIDFKEALRRRVSLLKGLHAPSLFHTIRSKLEFTPGAALLITILKELGATTAVLSGGFTSIISHVKAALGLDYAFANVLEVDKNNRLTGNLEANAQIIDAAGKLSHLCDMIQRHDVSKEYTVAVGDGANDLPMLQHAGLGVAFNAKPHVQRQAKFHINHWNLGPIIFYLGLSVDDAIELVESALYRTQRAEL